MKMVKWSSSFQPFLRTVGVIDSTWISTDNGIMAYTHHHRIPQIPIIETIHFLVSSNCYYNNEFYAE